MKIVEDHDEVVFKIGQNQQENWDLIDEAYKNNDQYIWFHLNSFPSCHVIVEDENPDNNTIIEAAQLCKENSKYKNVPNVKICYTRVCNLKKEKKIGSVSFHSNRKKKYIVV